MEAFAERAGRELPATGERVRRRVVETRDDLTPQELQIARLASEGLSNPEIGARMFISARTIEWHLRRVSTSSGSAHAGSWRTRCPVLTLASCRLEPARARSSSRPQIASPSSIPRSDRRMSR
jgi:DNA-binding CsgD family transcriptional regulator